MKKNTTITFLILLSIIVSSNIYAEEANAEVEVNTTSVAPTVMPVSESEKPRREPRPMPRGEIKERVEVRRDDIKAIRASTTTDIKVLREQNQEGIKKMRADFKAEAKNKTSSTTEVFKEKRTELIKAIQEKRDIFKGDIEAKRAAIASTTASIRASFKADLEKIKDEKKKVRVEKVGNNLIELNTKITEKSSERVNKIEEVLIALESRADKSALEGLNMTNVLAHIANSEAVIAEARLAISTQATKTYNVTITDEATAKASLQASRDLLKKDIEVMNTKIKSAHDATKKAVEAFKVVAKVNATTTSTLNN
jgi:hypothetical protein